jgi:hypothetical protein
LCFRVLCLLLEETHQATLMRRAESDNSTAHMVEKPSFFSSVAVNWRRHNVARTIGQSITIPTTIALHPSSLAILVLSAVLNGLVDMILSSLGSVFQSQYHFPPTTAGLLYLGIDVSGIGGLAAIPGISDFFSKRRAHTSRDDER